MIDRWRETTLGEVVELKRGYDLPASQRVPGSVPIVSSSGVSGFHAHAKVRGPGVVTGRYGTLGQVFFIQDDFWPLNTSLYVRDFKGNDPRFVAALLEALDLGASDGAAAVPGVNRNHLHQLPVRVPEPNEQRSIGRVFAVLDDLIANNQRRVALLEKTVGAIYREWFVHFRYPGHERDELVKSPLGPIPSGWSASTLGDSIELAYGKALKAIDRRSGGVNVIGSSGIVGQHDSMLVAGPAIVVGRKGNVGNVIWSDADCWPIDTTYFVRTSLPLRFVYRQLLGVEFVNSHAAVPGLSREHVYAAPWLVPESGLMARFDEMASRLGDESSLIDRSSSTLAEMRDLLLPKLVTGQIDVSKLDLDAVLEGAAV